jgi:predicted alpha/beta hydrolase family esterase
MYMNTFDHVYILHGCFLDEGSVPPQDQMWEHWVTSELVARGYDAVALKMPTPWIPIYTEWKKAFEKYPLSADSVLVGHSCGCAFLVRYLSETKQTVKKLILVAPAKIAADGDATRDDLYGFDLPDDGSGIASEIVIFTSNDRPRHLAALKLYADALHPRILTLENKGHFLYNYMKTNAFPELLNEILGE